MRHKHWPSWAVTACLSFGWNTPYRCELHADTERIPNLATELCDCSFDLNEYEMAEDVKDNDGMGTQPRQAGAKSNFCFGLLALLKSTAKRTEQLEETEMWYCNRCKKHIGA
jgi:hypothetical protein